MDNFGIGRPVRRTEDVRYLTGAGRYLDDIVLDDMAHGLVVRSAHAHGNIRRIDTAQARAAEGVLAVYTGADMEAAGYGMFHCPPQLKNADGTPLAVPPWRVLALDRVGVEDNFYHLGGHSLLAMQIGTRLNEVFPFTVPLRDIFEYSTVASMGDRLRILAADNGIDALEACELLQAMEGLSEAEIARQLEPEMD